MDTAECLCFSRAMAILTTYKSKRVLAHITSRNFFYLLCIPSQLPRRWDIFLGAACKVKVSQNNVASSNLFNQLHEGILKIASPPLSHSGSGSVTPGQAWCPSKFHPPRAHPVRTQAQPCFSLDPKGLVKSRPFRNTATETQPNQSPSSDSTRSARFCQAYHFCTGDIPTSQPPASNTR